MAVVFRDELDRDTVVRTACGRVSSSSPISHRGHAPASSSSGVVYRSTTNRLQIHAAQSDRGFLAPDDHWTPYILEYMCMLHLFSNSLPKISPYTFLTTLLPSHPSLSFLFPLFPLPFLFLGPIPSRRSLAYPARGVYKHCKLPRMDLSSKKTIFLVNFDVKIKHLATKNFDQVLRQVLYFLEIAWYMHVSC